MCFSLGVTVTVPVAELVGQCDRHRPAGLFLESSMPQLVGGCDKTQADRSISEIDVAQLVAVVVNTGLLLEQACPK